MGGNDTPRDRKGKTKTHIKCALEIYVVNSLSLLGCCSQRCKIMVSLHEKPEYNTMSLLPAALVKIKQAAIFNPTPTHSHISLSFSLSHTHTHTILVLNTLNVIKPIIVHDHLLSLLSSKFSKVAFIPSICQMKKLKKVK